MKYFKIAGLCLVSMLAMGMALAGNAAAALLWLVCLEGSGLTKYSTNQCTEASSTGKWQSLGLPSGVSDTVRLLAFSLRLTDSGTGVTVECPDAGVGWGLIESPNKGQIKVAEVTKTEAEANCKVIKGLLTCEGAKAVTKVKGLNLPWTVEIFETEKKNLTQIKGKTGAKERPGWEIECGGVVDKCEEETGHPEFNELVNGVTKGVLLVLARFEGKTEAECSVGGKAAGHVAGLIAILLWNGNGLSITSL
jgi:hypothetical protein